MSKNLTVSRNSNVTTFNVYFVKVKQRVAGVSTRKITESYGSSGLSAYFVKHNKPLLMKFPNLIRIYQFIE